MTIDSSVFAIVLHASIVVQAVMLILLLISFYSWMVIFRKYAELGRAKKQADVFENKFWAGNQLNALYEEITARPHVSRGMEGIFEVGFKEFVRLRQGDNANEYVLQGSQRMMRVSLAKEIDELETSLPFLATAGSISPYIGLFGTVWGIMSSFHALGSVQQAALSDVAPGIAEALVATAIGLFAAIPAVVGYNRYSNQIERLINRYDTFVEEFSAILQRQQN